MPMVLAFQFTPLREGRRGAVLFPAHSHPISIHAPPRGATLSIRFFHVSARISIHAPPRGATETARRASASSSISIHAPPRGATDVSELTGGSLTISIHAPPRGATAKDMQFLQIFCSTLTNQHGLTIVPGNLSRLFW